MQDGASEAAQSGKQSMTIGKKINLRPGWAIAALAGLLALGVTGFGLTPPPRTPSRPHR